MITSAPDVLAAACERPHTPIVRTGIHISARVTVLYAAAGFGKTSAMADACERLQSEGASVAWLPCAALALPSGDRFEAIRHFVDHFADAETVFLDDLEYLDPEHRRVILQAFLLTAAHRRIVLAARSLNDLGLARLLAEGAAQLIQADTLRWRRRQVADLWKSRLSAKQIDAIDSIAQGWPAVSQLLAQFIYRGGDSDDKATLLNASLVNEYISTEVLASFMADDLTLLAMTSIVDTFDDALIRGLGQECKLSCAGLVRRLPGLCHQGAGGRLKYNRALALHLLQLFVSLPQKTQTMALVRAADWASAEGDVVLAGTLAARAGDRQRIVAYVARAGGLKIHVTKGFAELRAVVAAAGETLTAQEPGLKLLKCMVLLKDGRIREAMNLYQEAAAALPPDADSERAAAFLRLSLMLYGCQLEVMGDIEIAETARRFDEDPVYREIGPTTLAIMHSQQANFPAAKAAISTARAFGRQAGITYNVMFLDIHSAGVALACGDLEEAKLYLSKARLRWREEYPHDDGAEAVMLSVGALLAFERGNIHQAKQNIGKVGHRLAHSEAWLDIYFAGYEPMFRLQAREEGLLTALASIESAAAQLQEAGLDRIAIGLRNIGTCLIGEKILKGQKALPLAAAANSHSCAQESWQEKEFRLLAAAYTELAHSKPGRAKDILDSLITFAEQHSLLRTKLRGLLLRQVAKDRLGEGDSANGDFRAALDIGARTGLRQAFLEFGSDTVKARIDAGAPEPLAAFAKSLANLLASSQPNPSPDVLTPKEAQVLQLLSSGDSDKGIARQLHVTEFAVRFHLKNIYRKLGVHDRNSAVKQSSV